MRDTTKQKLAVLVTDDPAVEAAARTAAKRVGDALQLLHSNRDATCVAFDAAASETFAILDVDAEFGSRAMFSTIAGLLPVIAVTSHEKPWLRSLLRHHRIGASMIKPVTADALQLAFRQIVDFHGPHELSSQ